MIDPDTMNTTQDSLERYKLLVESSRDFIFFLAVNGTILDVNPSVIRQYGYTRGELLGQNIRMLRNPSDDVRIAEQLRTAFLEGITFEAVHFRKDKHPFPVEIVASRADIFGKPGVISIIRDITKRKKDEEALRNLMRAVEQSDGIVVITDTAGTIQYVNPRFCEVTGYGTEEAIGQNSRLLNSGIQTDSFYKDLWDTILSGMNWKGELLNRRKDGSLYWTILSISPVKDDTGVIVSFIAIQDDITRFKDMQAELTAKNEELQAVLQSLQAAQVYLIQQEKMAGVGMLAAGVAHEINNPLGFVNSNFETLKHHLANIIAWIGVLLQEGAQETSDPETALRMLRRLKTVRGWSKAAFIVKDVRDLLPDMQSGITRITEIVQNLREFSQVDVANRVSEYDFNANIRNAVMLISSDLSTAATLEMNLLPLEPIHANGGEINQVLINILTNAVQAVKSSHDGSMGKIRIRTDQNETNVILSLEDDGPGVPMELRTRIFEPFFTTKPVGEGAGLGLGIAHDIIVRRHKGTLFVEDSDLGGARFVLTLPKA